MQFARTRIYGIGLGLATLVVTCSSSAALMAAEPASESTRADWGAEKSYNVNGLRVGVSAPRLVARSKGYLWFPTVVRLSGGRLLALMSNYADIHTNSSTASLSWSGDGGLSWSKTTDGLYSDSALELPSGQHVLLPYYMKEKPRGTLTAPYQTCDPGKTQVESHDGLVVTDWPRPLGNILGADAKLALGGFVFNGQTVPVKGDLYLATLYGNFQDTKRYSLVAAESADGVHWKFRTTIADEKCPLAGGEGPCESALCRLADGRLLCVFRMDSGKPYGRSFSSDDGQTWTAAEAIPGVISVQPSLVALPGGTVCLSGGRPGLFLWLNADGKASQWEPVDIAAHHNQFVKDELISPAMTSAYTEIVALDDRHLLYIYDRVPNGWNAIPADSPVTNSVWVVRVAVDRAGE